MTATCLADNGIHSVTCNLIKKLSPSFLSVKSGCYIIVIQLFVSDQILYSNTPSTSFVRVSFYIDIIIQNTTNKIPQYNFCLCIKVNILKSKLFIRKNKIKNINRIQLLFFFVIIFVRSWLSPVGAVRDHCIPFDPIQ